MLPQDEEKQEIDKTPTWRIVIFDIGPKLIVAIAILLALFAGILSVIF